MADITFDIAPRRTEPITFRLATPGSSEEESNRVYSFVAPKMAVMLLPLIDAGDTDGLKAVQGSMDWLDAGLSTEDSDHIEARLRDPKDDLDIEHLGGLIGKINEFLAARPTS